MGSLHLSMWLVSYSAKSDDLLDTDFLVKNNIGWVVPAFSVLFGERKTNEDNDGSQKLYSQAFHDKNLFEKKTPTKSSETVWDFNSIRHLCM